MAKILEVLQMQQKLFSYEAFWFLTNNAHLWIEYPKNILFRITHCNGCNFFTTNIENAVIAQTYVSRIRYWKLARKNFEKLKSVEGFERIITKYPVTEDHNYFCHFLDWVSYIFYLTIFCYKQGYDYIEVGKLCLGDYPNVDFFHSVGGWDDFDNMCFRISEEVNAVTTACSEQRTSDTKFLKFNKSVRKFERRHRYESNKWTRINRGNLKAEYVMQEASAKFRAVSKFDSRRVIPGYKFLITDESYLECPKLEVSYQEDREATSAQQSNENEAEISAITMGIFKRVISGDRSETPVFASNQNEISCTGSGYISEDTEMTPSILSGSEDKIGFTKFAGNVDGKKCAFIISEEYLRKRKAAKKSRSECKRGIKICSHSQNTDKFVRNLQETLDRNISQRNYRKIDKNVLVVCPPDCDYRNKDTQIIVLDTSTEEEDDDFDISEQDIPFDCFKTQNTNFDVSHSLENDESNLRSSTEISTDMQFVPTRSTGARPKVKPSVKKKSERRSSKSTKCPQIENLQSDLEKFNPDTFQSETRSISNRNQEQRQKEYTDEDIERFASIIANVLVDLQNCSLPTDPKEDCRDK